jgi:aminopeptidase N
MKNILLTSFLLVLSIAAEAQSHICAETKNRIYLPALKSGISSAQSITDSIRVAKYIITIDTLDFVAKTLRAKTEVHAIAKVNNVTQLRLDLLQLTVDSLMLNGQTAVYTYNDTVISIPVTPPANAGDTIKVTVYYRGSPKQDASGWGGFYFTGLYAFNLGVGFQAVPHNLGKVWFPCIDVFNDKAEYEFFITTSSANKAFANGVLLNEISNPNGTKTWHWKISEPIPTYLACMAVGPYITKTKTSNGIPVEWACIPTDTTNINNTFQNLDTVLSTFINAWGPYPFSKVGYSLVPFNSGAMEHATAITIGRAFINGTLFYETLWAHELAHMWWGDNVTCLSAQDMWLNEGWATFNEALMTEAVYGNQAYKNWIHSNHRKVLQFAHVPQNDGAYLTLNNIPETHTYGMHVYQKAADIIHTMRHYMGDSAFFNGCKFFHNNRAYGNASSYDLRDDLQAATGIDMNRFFDDWIFTPGWPHFSIDSVVYVPGGLDHYFVYTRQRSRGNNNHIYKMPVEITFSNDTQDTTVTIVIDSATNVFHIPLIQTADWIMLDRNQKVSDAIVDYERDITTLGNQTFPETGVTLNVQSLGISVPPVMSNKTRIEHHYVTPDGFKQPNPGIRLSDYHYWSVDGRWLTGFLTKATFLYDGSNSLSNGYLDNNLITGPEDSVIILYRAGTWDDWQVVNSFTRVIANPTDKRGSITIDTLLKGEYVLGYYDYTVTALKEPEKPEEKFFSMIPNPASHFVTFKMLKKLPEKSILKITDNRGSLVFEQPVNNSLELDTSHIAAGTYLVNLIHKNKVVQTEKLLIAR